MSVSPFAITAAIINESSDNIDLLRIIAADARSRLNERDRIVLIEAADELAAARAACVSDYAKRIEAERQLQATRDQLAVANKTIGKVVYETLTMGDKFSFEMKIHQGFGK
jgi:hypothetical protein